MGEISAASNEQAIGVAKVGGAVQQMDQSTQQNAALVEEMAAAASSLKTQAMDLVHTVAVFKLNNAGQHTVARVAPSTPRPAPAPKPAPRAVAAPPAPKALQKSSPAPAAKQLAAPAKPAASNKADDEWETF
jgi:hypothetical protein